MLALAFGRDSYLDRLLSEFSCKLEESGTPQIVEVFIDDNASCGFAT